MIVVKVELHSAINGQVSELGKMVIFNDGTSNAHNIGHYKAHVLRKGRELRPAISDKDYIRSGEVNNYPRLSYPVWRLILKALRSCYPEEK